MRMRKAFFAILIVLTASRLSAEEPTWATARQLQRNPQEFDKKKVCALGYFDGHALFADCDAAKRKRLGITIDPTTFFNPGTHLTPAPPMPGISDLRDLTNHYVRIIGTFHYRIDRAYRFEINHVVYFRSTGKCKEKQVRVGRRRRRA